MKIFSGLLLELYRLAQDAPGAEFQTRALDCVREALPFDSAFWATGVAQPETAVIAHTAHLYRQPREMLESWGRINAGDELAFEAFRNPGVTINAALCGAGWQSRFSAEVRDHINRYGMAHVLSTIIAEPVLQIWSGIGFYRADPAQPFTEAERLLIQNLMAHLSEAWHISRFNFLSRTDNDGKTQSYGRAICDGKGVLYNADRNFSELMRTEWPSWNGPQLPPALLEKLSGSGHRRYAGCHTVVAIETVNQMELLTARRTSAADKLSAREHDVAMLFAKGADYHAIADSLHISPATVRNHLQHIYTKLGVNNKIEMARLMRDH